MRSRAALLWCDESSSPLRRGCINPGACSRASRRIVITTHTDNDGPDFGWEGGPQVAGAALEGPVALETEPVAAAAEPAPSEAALAAELAETLRKVQLEQAKPPRKLYRDPVMLAAIFGLAFAFVAYFGF